MPGLSMRTTHVLSTRGPSLPLSKLHAVKPMKLHAVKLMNLHAVKLMKLRALILRKVRAVALRISKLRVVNFRTAMLSTMTSTTGRPKAGYSAKNLFLSGFWLNLPKSFTASSP